LKAYLKFVQGREDEVLKAQVRGFWTPTCKFLAPALETLSQSLNHETFAEFM